MHGTPSSAVSHTCCSHLSWTNDTQKQLYLPTHCALFLFYAQQPHRTKHTLHTHDAGRLYCIPPPPASPRQTRCSYTPLHLDLTFRRRLLWTLLIDATLPRHESSRPSRPPWLQTLPQPKYRRLASRPPANTTDKHQASASAASTQGSIQGLLRQRACPARQRPRLEPPRYLYILVRPPVRTHSNYAKQLSRL